MRNHNVSVNNSRQEPDNKGMGVRVEGPMQIGWQVDRYSGPALIPNVYIILVVVEGCKMEILFNLVCVQVDL